MSLEFIDRSGQYDMPFYKRLSANDVGLGGKQAGFLVNAGLVPYFPALDMSLGQDFAELMLHLHDEGNYLSSTGSRFRFETWNFTRNPEYRITGVIKTFLDRFLPGDFLIAQRNIKNPNEYKIYVCRAAFDERYIEDLQATISSKVEELREALDNTTDAREIKNKTNNLHFKAGQLSSMEYRISERERGHYEQELWEAAHGQDSGFLIMDHPPASNSDMETADEELRAKQNESFQIRDLEASLSTSTRTQVARSIQFAIAVKEQYEHACVVCNKRMKSPNGSYEVDAAHVIPRAVFGPDDIRNGLALCKRHHWAFDHGLFGLDDERRIIVPESIAAMDENADLAELAGEEIAAAKDPNLQVHEKALAWHREVVMIQG